MLGLAQEALSAGEFQQATRLFAAATQHLTLNRQLAPIKRIVYEHDLADLRTRLGMAAFTASWTEGKTMTVQRALAFPDVRDGTPEQVRRLSSCGKQVLGVEVRVVTARGEDVQPAEIGEIMARGPNVMLGYWRLPEATATALEDGWMHTGDLATVDEENYLYIIDRAKEMIISGGENIYSVEVEQALYTHPVVLEAAVIGIPHEHWGEAVHAVVVCKPGSQVSSDGGGASSEYSPSTFKERI